MTSASQWMRASIAPALSNILILGRATESGGLDPHGIRREIDAALSKIKLDTTARDLGFNNEHLERVRLALVTAADEFSQRPKSLCNYSTPAPPGEKPLLQQKYFQNRIDLGNRFFSELSVAIEKHRPSDVEYAVLEVFSLCIALGVRGMYEALELDGLEAIRTRLFAKLRSNFALLDGPPRNEPAQWHTPRPAGKALPLAALFTVLFAVALLLTYQRITKQSAEVIGEHMSSLLSLP